jgi:hypothetical protein
MLEAALVRGIHCSAQHCARVGTSARAAVFILVAGIQQRGDPSIRASRWRQRKSSRLITEPTPHPSGGPRVVGKLDSPAAPPRTLAGMAGPAHHGQRRRGREGVGPVGTADLAPQLGGVIGRQGGCVICCSSCAGCLPGLCGTAALDQSNRSGRSDPFERRYGRRVCPRGPRGRRGIEVGNDLPAVGGVRGSDVARFKVQDGFPLAG